jgi:hypothetical protein
MGCFHHVYNLTPRFLRLTSFGTSSRDSHLAGHALGSYAIPFDRPVISLNLSIALRVVRRSFHMGHSCDAYELFEVSGDELGAVTPPH